jgi:hypothetical protein
LYCGAAGTANLHPTAESIIGIEDYLKRKGIGMKEIIEA